jgi:hypothetical protein
VFRVVRITPGVTGHEEETMDSEKTQASAPVHAVVVLRALCKYRGMLVVAEVSVRTDGQPGRCPECGSSVFVENAGWTECDCGFAYLSSDVERLTA